MTLFLGEPAVICALGHEIGSVRERLFNGESPGFQRSDAYSDGQMRWLGRAQLPGLPVIEVERDNTRNNALLLCALNAIRPQLERALAHVAPHRIGIVIGTSTSGMAEAEAAIRQVAGGGALPDCFHVAHQELGSPARFLARILGVSGPAYTVSTACSSSAKAIASGARLIAAGIAEAVLVGGVDTLCRFTVAGFAALEALSAERCNPFSANRSGINIGEGAALFLLSRQSGPVRLTGWGESSDAYHVSAPDPEGGGARRVIDLALKRAGGNALERVGYVNLHGTGTRHNDAMEARVVRDLLGDVPASSTKPLTGHTLGAAGALEAAFCWLTVTDTLGRLPPHLYDGVRDRDLADLNLVTHRDRGSRPPSAAMSLSFAFGGSNAAILLERA